MMINIALKIEQDFLKAYKAGQKETTEALKMLKASLTNARIELGRELEDNDVISVLNKELKKRQEAIKQFLAAKRKDLADKEQNELILIKKYLPAELSNEELEKRVKAVIEKIGAKTADFGKVMKKVMSELKGQTDGGRAAEIVKKHLKQ